jgi:2,4-dienoyl-CoA reductase-like NADH-dependent reductase (Old Yellow Enzyme family)
MNNSDPILTNKQIGGATIKNRFVRSATYENSADEDGSITENYFKIYSRLSSGNIGLIITGMIYTSDDGKSYSRQAGLHTDKGIQAFADLTEHVHENGSKMFAQLCHGGRQSQVQGFRPMAPSPGKPDTIYKVYPRAMTHDEIMNVVKSFGQAAKRAQKAGFDGIQIHAAHGYLVSEFLSPYFNRRKDEWGGSSAKRFNLLKRVYESIREATGGNFPVIVKINIEDNTPKPGLRIEESAEHIGRLAEIGIDAVEISCGTLAFSMFNQSRGNVPVDAFAKTMPAPFRSPARMFLKMQYPENKFKFYENYNNWACGKVKQLMHDVPLILVGGLRTYQVMEKIIREKDADFVAMSRPLIREPLMIKNWIECDRKAFTCTNCNNCLGGLALHEELKCNQNRAF